jgi:glycosyltransferase involved in cell wall biosynthesis
MQDSKPLRTFFVTMMIYPPIGGEFLRNWQNINIMRQFGPVGVFSIFNQASQIPALDGIEFWHHYNFTEVETPRSRFEQALQWIRQSGLTYYCPYLRAAAKTLEQLLTQFQPDLVIFEQLWLYPYLPTVKSYLKGRPCRLIFDAHNIEAPLYQVTKCSDRGLRSRLRRNLHVPQIQASERNLIEQADQVWLCSVTDHLQLDALYGLRSQVYVIPNGVDLACYDSIRSGQLVIPNGLDNCGHNVLFMANFAHLPNADAAHLLIHAIYPQLQAIDSDCRLLLVGRHPTHMMLAAAQQNPRIIVTGEIPDVKPYLAAASVMIVPLRQGSGTRLKILEAFAAGCPVVSTVKGAEGLTVKDGEHLLIRNDTEMIVLGVLELWSNPVLPKQLVDAAYKLVRSQYAWKAITGSIEVALQDLLNYP